MSLRKGAQSKNVMGKYANAFTKNCRIVSTFRQIKYYCFQALYIRSCWPLKTVSISTLDPTGNMFTLHRSRWKAYPVVLSWCLTSSKKSSTSLISLCLFQFFFLFLLTRFLRLLTIDEGSTFEFKLRKPGCFATTRFSLLADAMLEF